MFTRRAKRSCSLTATIAASTCATEPAITVCRGDRNPARLTSRVVGEQLLGRLGVHLQQAHRALAGQPRHQP